MEAMDNPANSERRCILQSEATKTSRFLWPLAVSVPLALFVPGGLFSVSAELCAYVSLVQVLIPNIQPLASVSRFPDATRLVSSVAYSKRLVSDFTSLNNMPMGPGPWQARIGACFDRSSR